MNRSSEITGERLNRQNEKNFEKRNFLYIIHAGIAARLAVRAE